MGYNSDIPYTHGYYQELNPSRVFFWQTLEGYRVSHPRAALELGYGNGVTFGINSLCPYTAWTGVDINPDHYQNAVMLAPDYATSRLICSSFRDFVHQHQQNTFDFIVLHGIWSWVDEEVRHDLLEILKTRLVPGGVVYFSYNVLPGWSEVYPVRQLLHHLYSSYCHSPQYSKIQAIDASRQAILNMIQEGMLGVTKYGIKEKLMKALAGETAYISHEFLNGSWHSEHFFDIQKKLAPAELSFMISADLMRPHLLAKLPKSQQRFLEGFNSTPLRETMADYAINTQFRKDLWVKGTPRRFASTQEIIKGLQSYLLIKTSDTESLKNLLERKKWDPRLLDEALKTYEKIGTDGVLEIEELWEYYRNRSLDYEAFSKFKSFLVSTLIGNACTPIRKETFKNNRDSSAELNKKLAYYYKAQNSGGFLVNQWTYEGVYLTEIEIHLLNGYVDGEEQEETVDKMVIELRAQKRNLKKSGEIIERDQDVKRELKAVFVSLLKKLNIE